MVARIAAVRKLLHPVIGNQRTAALRVGLLGAYPGRGAMLFMTGFLINNSWIKLIGAAYLIHLAFENLGDMTGGGSEEGEDLGGDDLRMLPKFRQNLNKPENFPTELSIEPT